MKNYLNHKRMLEESNRHISEQIYLILSKMNDEIRNNPKDYLDIILMLEKFLNMLTNNSDDEVLKTHKIRRERDVYMINQKVFDIYFDCSKKLNIELQMMQECIKHLVGKNDINKSKRYTIAYENIIKILTNIERGIDHRINMYRKYLKILLEKSIKEGKLLDVSGMRGIGKSTILVEMAKEMDIQIYTDKKHMEDYYRRFDFNNFAIGRDLYGNPLLLDEHIENPSDDLSIVGGFISRY